ncbi:MAG: beta-ketoacyl-[acyl-carrier-protein] synthase family protein [Thermodesulfovibrionales bacterium]|nr:beta-ketoacyl-[acyl-carrier-protein] synthase family protein [Thermodesulfovibrionales bacterium]
MKKAVITGIGIVSPVGIGKDEYWHSLEQGKTGFRLVSLFDTSALNVHRAGEIGDFDPVPLLGKKGLRTLDRSTRLINVAAKLALDDSGLEITEENSCTIGVSIGATFGSLHSIAEFDRQGLVEGPKYVNPSYFPNTVLNSPASQVSIRFKIRGFNATISTGFCAGLDAVSYAADFIRLGRADIVLAGGVEELCEETFLGFYNLGCLSGIDGSEPVSCPFDVRRKGIILSEGAAVLVLEEEKRALERGAEIYATVLGYSNSFDYESTIDFSHNGKGLGNAIKNALKEASLAPEEIDYIGSCANATRGLDRMETLVVKDVFGKYAYDIPVSSIKSMIGETFSASGALSLAASTGCLHRGFIPPTVNYEEQDPKCDLDYVPNAARKKMIENALVLTADPYGNNIAMVIGKDAR